MAIIRRHWFNGAGGGDSGGKSPHGDGQAPHPGIWRHQGAVRGAGAKEGAHGGGQVSLFLFFL